MFKKNRHTKVEQINLMLFNNLNMICKKLNNFACHLKNIKNLKKENIGSSLSLILKKNT